MSPGPLRVAFVGGRSGNWRVRSSEIVRGTGLPQVSHLDVLEGSSEPLSEPSWVLRGVTSNERYVTLDQRQALLARQPDLHRPEATRAALIPITKSAPWWDLTQEERLEIFSNRSHHISVGLEYLPAVARRLHHGRDLGEEFDFLTWFEYPPEATDAFEDLVGRLRETPEWEYVEREIDIRLERG